MADNDTSLQTIRNELWKEIWKKNSTGLDTADPNSAEYAQALKASETEFRKAEKDAEFMESWEKTEKPNNVNVKERYLNSELTKLKRASASEEEARQELWKTIWNKHHAHPEANAAGAAEQEFREAQLQIEREMKFRKEHGFTSESADTRGTLFRSKTWKMNNPDKNELRILDRAPPLGNDTNVNMETHNTASYYFTDALARKYAHAQVSLMTVESLVTGENIRAHEHANAVFREAASNSDLMLDEQNFRTFYIAEQTKIIERQIKEIKQKGSSPQALADLEAIERNNPQKSMDDKIVAAYQSIQRLRVTEKPAVDNLRAAIEEEYVKSLAEQKESPEYQRIHQEVIAGIINHEVDRRLAAAYEANKNPHRNDTDGITDFINMQTAQVKAEIIRSNNNKTVQNIPISPDEPLQVYRNVAVSNQQKQEAAI